jgi:hypothetical protein
MDMSILSEAFDQGNLNTLSVYDAILSVSKKALEVFLHQRF